MEPGKCEKGKGKEIAEAYIALNYKLGKKK